MIGVDASDRFLARLKGIVDPEEKRKRIGAEFISVFVDEEIKLVKSTQGLPVKFLVQGTLYPDVIESVSVKGPSAVIKSHHNVGGLPENMPFGLIEPLRDLFKDEVRQIGRELGLPEEILVKHPFPGPGLAVRVARGNHPGKARDAPRRRRRRGGRNPARRTVRKSLAGLCRPAAGAKRGSNGRRPHLWPHHSRPRGRFAGCHDGRLVAPAL